MTKAEAQAKLDELNGQKVKIKQEIEAAYFGPHIDQLNAQLAVLEGEIFTATLELGQATE